MLAIDGSQGLDIFDWEQVSIFSFPSETVLCFRFLFVLHTNLMHPSCFAAAADKFQRTWSDHV